MTKGWCRVLGSDLLLLCCAYWVIGKHLLDTVSNPVEPSPCQLSADDIQIDRGVNSEDEQRNEQDE